MQKKLKKRRRQKVKYNEKYDLYIDDDLVIYYWDKKLDKLMQRTVCKQSKGYLTVRTKIGIKLVHRLIWETFIGEIPDGYEIDHINTIRTDNRLDNLRLVTHKENCNNPLTVEIQKGNINKRGKTTSEFGRKFFEHYGLSQYQALKLYNKEYLWYRRHNNKCSWEV